MNIAVRNVVMFLRNGRAGLRKRSFLVPSVMVNPNGLFLIRHLFLRELAGMQQITVINIPLPIQGTGIRNVVSMPQEKAPHRRRQPLLLPLRRPHPPQKQPRVQLPLLQHHSGCFIKVPLLRNVSFTDLKGGRR